MEKIPKVFKNAEDLAIGLTKTILNKVSQMLIKYPAHEAYIQENSPSF